jgi:CDP-diacylglycerol--glycerol-3-phosphate 3-phosphatidyltransferase
VLADLGLVPIWVAIVFITRSSIVDSIRYAAISHGETAFGSIHSQLGRVLVSGRFMRGFYGALKAITFGWAFFLQPLPILFPSAWQHYSVPALWITGFLVYASVVICLLRALPVILEFLNESRPFRRTKPAGVL